MPQYLNKISSFISRMKFQAIFSEYKICFLGEKETSFEPCQAKNVPLGHACIVKAQIRLCGCAI